MHLHGSYFIFQLFSSVSEIIFDLFSVKEWHSIQVKKPYEKLLISKAYRNWLIKTTPYQLKEDFEN